MVGAAIVTSKGWYHSRFGGYVVEIHRVGSGRAIWKCRMSLSVSIDEDDLDWSFHSCCACDPWLMTIYRVVARVWEDDRDCNSDNRWDLSDE